MELSCPDAGEADNEPSLPFSLNVSTDDLGASRGVVTLAVWSILLKVNIDKQKNVNRALKKPFMFVIASY